MKLRAFGAIKNFEKIYVELIGLANCMHFSSIYVPLTAKKYILSYLQRFHSKVSLFATIVSNSFYFELFQELPETSDILRIFSVFSNMVFKSTYMV